MLQETTAKMRQKREKRPLKVKRPAVEQRYRQFFIPTPSTLWPQDDVNFSLEQPHFLKVVPTETVYLFPALT
jgi:hypothetical protein